MTFLEDSKLCIVQYENLYTCYRRYCKLGEVKELAEQKKKIEMRRTNQLRAQLYKQVCEIFVIVIASI